MIRRAIWFLIVFFFHVLSLLVVICFCAVYVNSNLGWIYGTILSVLIDAFIIQVLFSLLKSLFRELAGRREEK